MQYRIAEIEGIGPAYAEKLKLAGIGTTQHLLQSCGDSKGRKRVAQKSGLNEAQLLKWVNMADLMRVSGVGGEFAELLEAAGVDTIKELRNRNAGSLADRMREVNQARRLTRLVPSASTVGKWIEQAKVLPPIITH